eukprot:176210-Prorocentrum_minimum.AAC.1
MRGLLPPTPSGTPPGLSDRLARPGNVKEVEQQRDPENFGSLMNQIPRVTSRGPCWDDTIDNGTEIDCVSTARARDCTQCVSI